jgi:hypothetical protein
MDIWVGFLKFAFFVEGFVWQNERFSPSVHFRVALDNGIAMKLHLTVPNLITFPNQVFNLKSVNHISRYLNFSAGTPAKAQFHGKIGKSKN